MVYTRAVATLTIKVEQSSISKTRNGRHFVRSVCYSNLHLDEYESASSKHYAALAKETGIYAQFRIYINFHQRQIYYKTLAILDNSNGQSTRQFTYEEEGTNGREMSTTVNCSTCIQVLRFFSGKKPQDLSGD